MVFEGPHTSPCTVGVVPRVRKMGTELTIDDFNTPFDQLLHRLNLSLDAIAMPRCSGPRVAKADVTQIIACLLGADRSDYARSSAASALGDLASHGRLPPAEKVRAVKALTSVVAGRVDNLDEEHLRSDAVTSLAAMGRDARIALPALIAYRSWTRHALHIKIAGTTICEIVLADDGIRDAIDKLVAQDLEKEKPRKVAGKTK